MTTQVRTARARDTTTKPKGAVLLADPLKIKLLPRNMRTARLLAQMQQRIYPQKMQEDPHAIMSILASTDLSRGMFISGELVGYALCQRTNEEGTVYLYDFAILPSLQHRGLGTKLAQELLAATRKRGLKIKMHVRATSYPLFTNREKLRAVGYRLATDKFVRDFYFGEFGIHEDAHELVVEPVARTPVIATRTG